MDWLGGDRRFSRTGRTATSVADRMAKLARRSGRRFVPVVLMVAFLLGAFFADAPPVQVAAETSSGLLPYDVQLAQPNAGVLANAPPSELIAQEKQRQLSAVTGALDQLAKQGRAGAYQVDPTSGALHVQLSDEARGELQVNPLVASIEPASESASATPASAPTLHAPATVASDCTISSTNYLQVYSPFMWGQANVSGLSVTLTLEDGSQNVIGVAQQTTQAAPNNYVQIDRKVLYYETIFVDPTTPTRKVMIAPGDQVHVVLTGVNPSPGCSGQPTTDDRRITADNIQVWNSDMRGTVWGTTSAANATMYVTATSGSLNLGSYLTNGTSVTYAPVTSDGSGNFSVSQFLINGKSPAQSVTLKPGSTGFVRVVHDTKDEVYTVYGQEVFALENSYVAHGYAFAFPYPPSGIAAGVSLPRAPRGVTGTLLGSNNQVLSTVPGGGNAPQYLVTFSQMIAAGDQVSITIEAGPTFTVSPQAISGSVDLGGNQITGIGPANTPMIVGAGLVDGFMTKNFLFTYQQDQVTTAANGTFQTGGIGCGTSKLRLKPGAFGYAGYEDGNGDFIYEDFAAPTNHVLANFPYVEGYVANGTVTPSITLTDPSGALKSQAVATPILDYLTAQQLYLNVFYYQVLSQFVNPGDTVTVVSNSQTSSIAVDNLTAYVNTDNNTITGTAPAGAQLTVIPYKAKSDSETPSTDSSGNFSVANPFTNSIDTSCTSSPVTVDFQPGDFGRVYLAHPDGNAVFAVWGRSMHVNVNENYLQLYLFPMGGLDWWTSNPILNPTVTLNAPDGTSGSGTAKSDGSAMDYTQIYLTDSQGNKALTRAGDSLVASFQEGPKGGPNRDASVSLASIPLIIGTPDPISGTLGGVAPSSWAGSATLTYPTTTGATTMVIASRSYTAFGPMTFKTNNGTAVPIGQGYSGTVSFTSGPTRVWDAWAVTGIPVRIGPFLFAGQTAVCGTGPASSRINVHDVTNEPQDIVIGTGTSDAKGNFCVAVSPLVKGQVIMGESNGIYSQAVVVGIVNSVYLPAIER